MPTESIKNASLGKPVLNRFWRRLTEQRLYRQFVRPCLSLTMRDRLRAVLLPAAPPPPPPPNLDTIDHLLSVFVTDGQRLQRLTGRSTPFWDCDAVRAAHVDRYRRWEASAPLRKCA